VNSEAYSHLATSVLVGSIVLLLSVETLLEARLTLDEAVARRALRRWASVGVALCYLVALFLESENGDGVLWVTGPLLFGPLLVSWFYVVRRFSRALAFRLLPTAAFSFTSGALLVTSVHSDTPPFVLVLPTFLAVATIWSVVTAVRAWTVPRKLSGWPPPNDDAAK
jgi:hypothetical protein